jgi:hypothetical protein
MVLRLFLFAAAFLFMSCTDVEFNNPDDMHSGNYRGAVDWSSNATSSSSPAAPSSSSVEDAYWHYYNKSYLFSVRCLQD